MESSSMLTAFLKVSFLSQARTGCIPSRAAHILEKYSKIQFLHALCVLILSVYTYITKLESYYQHSFMACFPAVCTVGSFLREL